MTCTDRQDMLPSCLMSPVACGCCELLCGNKVLYKTPPPRLQRTPINVVLFREKLALQTSKLNSRDRLPTSVHLYKGSSEFPV